MKQDHQEDNETKEDKETRRKGNKEKRKVDGKSVSLSGFAARLWYATLWCPCWAISQLWFRYQYFGRTNVPAAGSVLLVANHQSHLDPVLVGLGCPRRLKYLARHDLFFWPFSWWIRALGAVPIDRHRGAHGGMKTTLKLLQQHEAVLVFPEGSRTHDGDLQPLRPGFCLLARRSGATIVPVAIQGAFDAMPRGSAFPKPHLISLTFMPPIALGEYKHVSDNELTALVTARIVAALTSARPTTQPLHGIPTLHAGQPTAPPWC